VLAPELIRELHRHRRWTRDRVISAARKVAVGQLRQSFPMGPGSLFNALAHNYGAEFVWFEALRGTPRARFPMPTDFGTLDQLLAAWKKLDERWDEYLGRVDEVELDRDVIRTNTAGKTYTTPAADVLLHVCAHSFYHTAQMVNMLRQLGVQELPETNLITMAREARVQT
jgi:uncharacterized damage-inducible protein DinB